MAGQFTELQRTYKLKDADGVARYTGVVQTGENEVGKPIADNLIPIGVVTNDERLPNGFSAGGDQSGKAIAVQIDGYANIVLGSVVAAGDRVILKTGGSAIKLPAVAGQYNVLGFVEKAGIVGDVVPIRMEYHVFTV